MRIVEPEDGCIYEIGQANALEMGLHSLRKQISIIPQIPFLMKETIKESLDPFNERNNSTIWSTLSKVQLRGKVESVIYFLFSCQKN